MKIYFQIIIAFLFIDCLQTNMTDNKEKIRYVALGDSYTICEGAGREESWPELLTKHLNNDKINIELIANPSRTG